MIPLPHADACIGERLRRRLRRRTPLSLLFGGGRCCCHFGLCMEHVVCPTQAMMTARVRSRGPSSGRAGCGYDAPIYT